MKGPYAPKNLANLEGIKLTMGLQVQWFRNLPTVRTWVPSYRKLHMGQGNQARNCGHDHSAAHVTATAEPKAATTGNLCPRAHQQEQVITTGGAPTPQ